MKGKRFPPGGQALRNGDTVVVIGGGPAGSSCSIALKRLARQQGLDLEVVVYERKDFLWQANVCVGVLSPPFQSLLAELGLKLPASLVQRRVSGYLLHGNRSQLYLPISESDREPTLVVDRSDLDSYLLESARDMGVAVQEAKVSGLRRRPDAIVVTTEDGGMIAAEAVVGAFGVDEGAGSILRDVIPDFRPPRVTRSVLVEVPLEEVSLADDLANVIHAFLLSDLPQVEFAALTPKRRTVAINVSGREVVPADLDAFLELPQLRRFLPRGRGQHQPVVGAFPSGFSGSLYSDRVVTIGNASGLLRPLKGKGINTGIRTAMVAAKTIAERGTSSAALSEFRRSVSDMQEEYRYGTILRSMYLAGKRLDLLDPVIELAASEPRLAEAFYSMVSGEDSYHRVVRRTFRPGIVGQAVRAIVANRLRGRRPAAAGF